MHRRGPVNGYRACSRNARCRDIGRFAAVEAGAHSQALRSPSSRAPPPFSSSSSNFFTCQYQPFPRHHLSKHPYTMTSAPPTLHALCPVLSISSNNERVAHRLPLTQAGSATSSGPCVPPCCLFTVFDLQITCIQQVGIATLTSRLFEQQPKSPGQSQVVSSLSDAP